MKNFLRTHKHVWVCAYLLFYFPAFFWLENREVSHYTVIQSSWDAAIPFLEIFIIPYLFWFVYQIAAVVFFLFREKSEYYKLTACLFLGMTVFLIVSYLMPNRLTLRPSEFERSNIFTAMVQFLYAIDTPTNVFPSIHVYNSLCVAEAVLDSRALRDRRGIRIGSVVTSALIILSTVFLKQHSLVDVAGAFVMAGFFHWAVYLEGYRTMWAFLCGSPRLGRLGLSHPRQRK